MVNNNTFEQISSLESIYEIRYQRVMAELNSLESKVEDQKNIIKQRKAQIEQQQSSFKQYKIDSYADLIGKNFVPDVIYNIKLQSSRYLSKIEKLKDLLCKEVEELNNLARKHKEVKIKVKVNLIKQRKYEFIKNNI